MEIKRMPLAVLSLAMVMAASASCYVSEQVSEVDKTLQDGKGTKQSDYEIIMENVRQMLMPTAEDSVVKTYNDEMTAEGSWADINYEDNTPGWDPQRHYHRIVPMALCYINPESEYCGNEKLYDRIMLSIQYWQSLNLTSPNWYHNQINEPMFFGQLLIVMKKGKKQLPDDMEATIIEKWKNNGSDPETMTGANLTETAMQRMYFSCITEDSELLKESLEYMFDPIKYVEDEGFQVDGCFFQHGHQLYIGGYGEVLLETVLQTAVAVRGTQYSLPEGKKKILREYVLGSWSNVIRGEVMHWNALGRQLTRPDFLRYPERRIPIIKNMIAVDEEYAGEYSYIFGRLQGELTADAYITPQHIHFFRGDYTLHIKEGYTFSVRLTSTRTALQERANGENNKGYNLSFGTTCVTSHGKEYYDLMPFWDWHKIPGVTAATDYLAEGFSGYGCSTFAGGVSDSIYGCTAFRYDDNFKETGTGASKGYFFFDDEVVCLGAGIHSTHDNVQTTVNSCWGKDEFYIGSDYSYQAKSGDIENYDASKLRWILHDGIGYFFPETQKVVVENKEKTGNWYWCSTQQEDKEIQGKLFTLGIEHSSPVTDAKYSYIVIPNSTTASMLEYAAKGNIDILANSDSVQVVHHKQKYIYECIFYRPCTYKGDIEIYSQQPCALIIKKLGNVYHIHIADPSQSRTNMTVGIKDGGMGTMLYESCDFSTVDEQYAGMTKAMQINAGATSIRNIIKDSIHISNNTVRFGNPVKGWYTITRLDGVKVSEGRIDSEEITFNQGSDGVYILNVILDSGENITVKIVIE